MRTETKAVNIFTFDELSEEAKEKAIEQYRVLGWNDNSYIYDEYLESARAFADMAGIKITGYELGYRSSGFSWTGFDDWNDRRANNLAGCSPVRLATWINNNWLSGLRKGKFFCLYKNGKHYTRKSKATFAVDECSLTGVYTDYAAMKVLLDFCIKPDDRTITELVDEAFQALTNDCEKSIEYANSDEAITESIKANEYEFTEDGFFY